MNTNFNYNNQTELLMSAAKGKILTGLSILKSVLENLDPYINHGIIDDGLKIDFILAHSLISEGIRSLKSNLCDMDLLVQCSTCQYITIIEVYLNLLSIYKHIPFCNMLSCLQTYFLVDNIEYLIDSIKMLLESLK